MKKTLVIGASENPSRHSHLAVLKLLYYGHPVVAVGSKIGKISVVNIEVQHLIFDNIDTITLYINPLAQRTYYEYILSLHPKRIIFNPGTENEEFMQLARANSISAIEACTLVLLSTGQY